MQSPNLQLYNKVFELGQGMNVTVVDYHDMTDDLPYPFFSAQNSTSKIERATLDRFEADVDVQVKLFSLDADKGAHDQLLYMMQMSLANLEQLDDYQVQMNDIQTNTMTYTETNQNIIQSNILAEYRVY